MVDAASLKLAIAGLTRAGCRVERVAHANGVIAFVAPDGGRWLLAVGPGACRLAGTSPTVPPSTHPTVADALRAVGPAPVAIG